MSSSPAISNKNARQRERRGLPRQDLKHYVVLLFFGEDNWGKLSNMSESGMCFEFSKAPSLRERINFSFQVMGCMPVPHDGRGLGESFEATGEVIWTRDFERVAGVQFVDLTEASREQIRQWLSFEASMDSSVPGEEALGATDESPAIETESFAPLTPSEPLSIEETNEALSELEPQESFAEPTRELEAAWPVEIPAFEEQAARIQPRQRPAPSQHSNPVIARLTFMVVAGCLAAFVVTAGVKLMMSRAAHRADVGEPVQGSAAGASDSSGTARLPAASVGTATPFQVEVTDVSGKRWILWFARNGSKSGADQMASNSATLPDFSESVSKTNAKRKETAPAEEPQPAKTFTLAAPIRPPGSTSPTGNLSVEAPAIPTDLTVPSRDPIGGALRNPEAPTPEAAVETRPVGGMVQQARLIRSVPPVYPSIAKATRVSGDVVVDALIDAKGNVTSVKIISGPVLLQQAAMQTVRQWKYEPARLDGQAVAMHLNVTVRFRIN